MELEHRITGVGIDRDKRHRIPVLFTPHAIESAREADPIQSWFARSSWGVFLATIYPLIALSPLAVLTMMSPESDHPPVAEVGVDCAIVGFTLLALQFVITARLRWIEAPFGLDALLVFHRSMALLATALLCAHPVLVAWAEGWSLLTRLRMPWYIWVGRVTLAALLVHVIANLFRRALHMPYERWRRLHNVFALSILTLGFVHAVGVGLGLEARGTTVVWSAVVVAALGCWLHNRAIRPRLLRRRPFRVVAVRPEALRVWTLLLEANQRAPLRFAPGQFQFLRLHGTDLSAEEHPFTIASSPVHPGRISLTIKESGDFTNLISRIRPGDAATVHGPFGRFSYTLYPDEDDLVFVAGGVGITPLMSMLRCMRDRKEPRTVLLVYASRRPSDILFYEELMAMQAHAWPLLTVIHVLSEPTSWWRGETGRVDADRLARLCESVEGKSFYLCGPPKMTGALVRQLRRMGVSRRRLHTDYFSL